MLPLFRGEPCCDGEHCRVPAQVSLGLLEATPLTAEIKLKTKFWSQMLNAQKGVSKGTVCGYVIFM